MEQILKIRLQFEEISQMDQSKLDKDMNKAGTSARDAFHRVAVENGDESMRMIGAWKQALKDWDWAHPIRSFQNLMSGAMDAIGQKFGKFGQMIFGGLIGLAANLARHVLHQIKGLIDAQAMVVKMYSQLETRSIGFGNSVGRSLQEITDVSRGTGDSIRDVAATYTTLGSMRVPVESLKDLTKLAHLGAYALGAERGQLTQLLGTLKVVGRVSDDLIGEKGMMGEFLKVQSAVGLTDTEMSGLMQSVSKTTMRMAAFGAKGKDIVAMATVTARLTGLFGKLGLGADRAGQMIDKLMDPSLVAENAYQIRMMGLSMSEYLKMIKGGNVDQTKMTKGLVDAAKIVARLADSTDNVYAIQARAQMLGFSNMEEALRIAKEGDAMLAKMTGTGADLQKQASEGMSSLKNAWETLGNMFGAVLAKPLSRFMGLLTQLLQGLSEWLIKNQGAVDKFFTTMADAIGSWIEGGGIEKVIAGLKTFWNVLQAVGKFLVKFGPTLGIVIVALAGIGGAAKLLGPILGGLSNLVGGLTGKLKDLSGGGIAKGMEGVAGATKTFGQAMQGMLKLALAGVAMLLIAGALWVLSKAIQNFATIDWMTMLKAGVALLFLAGIMLGIGLLFGSNPVGWIAIAGMLAFGLAVLMLAGAVWIIADALNRLKPDNLIALGAAASWELVKQFAQLGLAIGAFAASMILVGPIALVKMAAVAAILNSLTGLSAIEEPLSRIPGYIGALAASMAAFGANGGAVDKFIGFARSLRDIDGQKLNVAFQSAAVVPITGKLEGVQGDLTQNITASFNASTQMVVSAITDLKTMLSEKEDATLNHLYDMAKNTKRLSNR
jgi:hypothetical protein